MSLDFLDLKYLLAGSEIQKAGYQAVIKNQVLELLGEFHPVLAGTLPLDLFITGSDLDIICFAADSNLFKEKLRKSFGHAAQFTIQEKAIREINTVIARFQSDGFDFEIFGQPIPVKDQMAYQHLLIEHEILNEKGESFKKEIILLKQNGVKTEPAFAKLLNLNGDPYEALLTYSQ